MNRRLALFVLAVVLFAVALILQVTHNDHSLVADFTLGGFVSLAAAHI